MIPHLLRLSSLSLLLLCGHAAAQAPLIKTEIITLALENSDGTFYYASGPEIREFSSDRASLSFPVVYQGTPRFILRDNKEDFVPPPEGEKPVPPVAYTDLPKGASRVLIISAPTSGGGIRLLSYDVSKRSMKDGSYRIFNFSAKDIAIILGEQKVLVPSAADRILTTTQWSKEILSLPCQIGVVQDDGKTIKPAYSSIWGHRPIRRSMLFIFDGKRGKDSVLIRRLYDIILEKETADTPDGETATGDQE